MDGWFYCFGDGPTKTTLNLSTAQLKAGDTVLISGQVLDQSPASLNAPVTNVPVTLMYVPLGGTGIGNIGTVTTAYSGDFYYEWTVPNDVVGKYSIVTSFAGTPGYKASSVSVNFRSGPAELTQEEIIQQFTAAIPPPVDYTPMFYAVIAITVVALVISIYAAFIKKQQK